MSALRIVCILALPALAAAPPAVHKLYSLCTPNGWLLHIHDDGSAQLMLGAGGGPHTRYVPAGTFKPEAVRKALDGATLDPKGSSGTHFVVWYEEERKGPTDGPQPRYTTDEKVIVPLFEAAASKWKDNDPLKVLSGKRPGFGLKK